jgi:hypothetical protein
MIVNAAIFTCSICGEASNNICAYCTKDACRNHRCERCKRCSDCCECEVPLSAEEPAAPLEPAVPQEAAVPEGPVIAVATQPLSSPEFEAPHLEPFAPAWDARAAEMSAAGMPAMRPQSTVFLTAAESSVFVAGSVPYEPPVLETREPRELEPSELEPRDFEPREFEPREFEPREFEPRNFEPREPGDIHDSGDRDSTEPPE